MRLVRRLDAIATSQAAAAAEKKRGKALGIAWVKESTRVDETTLQPGEYIALDLWLDEPPADDGATPDTRDNAGTDALRIARMAERVTTNGADLGAVYDHTGADVGHIILLEDQMITFCDAKDRTCILRPTTTKAERATAGKTPAKRKTPSAGERPAPGGPSF
jgi:hypothetical protein